MQVSATEMAEKILAGKNIVFLTGAGVSVASGIPDYRSLKGVYTESGEKEPEYLLSRRALIENSKEFHNFVKKLYHKCANPNIIHDALVTLENNREVTVITQNIDGLHSEAGSSRVIEFHGSLASVFCEKCGEQVEQDLFLNDIIHDKCQGLLRPKIVLYDEQIQFQNIISSVKAIEQADVVVIVGTTFKVYPFAALIHDTHPDARIFAVNKEPLQIPELDAWFLGDACEVFERIYEIEGVLR